MSALPEALSSMPIQRILIVDDSPTERHRLTELLTGNGYAISIASDGSQDYLTKPIDGATLLAKIAALG